MKLKNSFFYTLREDSKEEETISGNLLVRTGMVKKVSNGIYMYLPLGLKTIKKIETVIRKHMDEVSQELLMPNLLPEEAYITSGRRENFGKDMMSLKDRYDRNYVLGPTHEEFFVEAAKMKVKSHRDLPFNIYQIGNKYRDEVRPRFGLIRVREFFMKDAYSFDKDLEGLDISYKKVFDAYHNIFKEIGLDYRVVTADTGVMGGLLSEEFQAVTNIGEDILVLCDCGFSSNIEVTKCLPIKEEKEEKQTQEIIHTPNSKTIKEVCDYLNVEPNKLVKTLVYNIDNEIYACVISGDRKINETKLLKLLNAKNITLATETEVESVANCQIGYVGPINLNCKIIIDNDILEKYNYVVGANKDEYHIKNVNTTDYEYYLAADIKEVKENDLCPKCNKHLYFKNGIEVGNTFKLGNKYSKSLDLKYLDKENNLIPVEMGCYGIGVGRILASFIEQNNDESGIVFNDVIAPYLINIVIVNIKDEDQLLKATNIYNNLNKKYDTILDDRDERVGVKFKDSDLIGIPYRITIGKKIIENIVELKIRKTNEVLEIPLSELEDKLKELIK